MSADSSNIPPYVRKEEYEIDRLFRALVKCKGSDLHLKVGRPPMLRVAGSLQALNRGPIDEDEMDRILYEFMNERNRKILQETGGADFAHIVKVDELVWRFRVNILNQMGRLGLVARKVNNSIPVFEKLFLPQVLEELCKYSQGMVLLAGITGSGKSTTIASMLDWINHRYKKHILTLEDPIEFTFTEDKCLINQREIGQDVCDFMTGMKHAVREDPDIILVGEMRDLETIETAAAASASVPGTASASAPAIFRTASTPIPPPASTRMAASTMAATHSNRS